MKQLSLSLVLMTLLALPAHSLPDLSQADAEAFIKKHPLLRVSGEADTQLLGYWFLEPDQIFELAMKFAPIAGEQKVQFEFVSLTRLDDALWHRCIKSGEELPLRCIRPLEYLNVWRPDSHSARKLLRQIYGTSIEQDFSSAKLVYSNQQHELYLGKRFLYSVAHRYDGVYADETKHILYIYATRHLETVIHNLKKAAGES